MTRGDLRKEAAFWARRLKTSIESVVSVGRKGGIAVFKGSEPHFVMFIQHRNNTPIVCYLDIDGLPKRMRNLFMNALGKAPLAMQQSPNYTLTDDTLYGT